MIKQKKKPGLAKDETFEKNRLFSTQFVDSVIKNHNPSQHSINQSRNMLEEFKGQKVVNPVAMKKNIAEMGLDALIDKFMNKDSHIHSTMMRETE